MMDTVYLYSDGSARGNPNGPGGYGTVLQYTDAQGRLHEREYCQGFRRTTNNRMELLGCIAGLEALKRPCRVEIFSDSKYLTDAFNLHWVDSWAAQGWKRKGGPLKNLDLWMRLMKAKESHDVHFHWIRGHAGHPQNERCDRLAVSAAEGKRGALLEDTGLGDEV